MQTINKGAPLDVAFINDLVNTVEQLVASTSVSPYKRTTVKDQIYSNGTSTSVKTSDVRIHAETFYATMSVDKRTGTFELAFTNFMSTPVVTVTPILTNPGTSRANIAAVTTSVNANRIVGYVVSDTNLEPGQQIALSLIAIGIPTN